MEFTDRYKALGIPYPNPETMCKGDCEGTGWVPVKKDDPNPEYRVAWEEAELKNPTDDEYHFIRCLDCDGAGKRKQ